jgi:hypothetical protein
VGERKSIAFLFDGAEVYLNYALVPWRGEVYVLAPIGDSAEYACTSSDVLITAYSFSKIKERLDAN